MAKKKRDLILKFYERPKNSCKSVKCATNHIIHNCIRCWGSQEKLSKSFLYILGKLPDKWIHTERNARIRLVCGTLEWRFQSPFISHDLIYFCRVCHSFHVGNSAVLQVSWINGCFFFLFSTVHQGLDNYDLSFYEFAFYEQIFWVWNVSFSTNFSLSTNIWMRGCVILQRKCQKVSWNV